MQGVTSSSQQTLPNAASSITVLPPPHPPIRAPPTPSNGTVKVLLLLTLHGYAEKDMGISACTIYNSFNYS